MLHNIALSDVLHQLCGYLHPPVRRWKRDYRQGFCHIVDVFDHQNLHQIKHI